MKFLVLRIARVYVSVIKFAGEVSVIKFAGEPTELAIIRRRHITYLGPGA